MLAGADFDCDPVFSTLHLEITHHNGIAAEVREGLTVGERVIVHPPDSVSEDVRVAW